MFLSDINIELIGLIIALILVVFAIIKIRNRLKIKRWLGSNFMDLKVIESLDGYDLEDYVFEQFKLMGLDVRALGKSCDYGVDIIVGEYGLQVKHYSGPIGISAVREVYAGSHYYGVKPVLIGTNYYTSYAIDMAKVLEIELIDVDDIKNWGRNRYKRNLNHTIGFYEMVGKHYKDLKRS